MTLFRFKWLRIWVRQNTSPLPIDKAALWKRRLSIIYALLAWNSLGFVTYMIFTNKADWAKYYGIKKDDEINLTPAQQWSKTLGIKDATVYRVSGLNISKYQIHNEFAQANEELQLGAVETKAQ